LTLTEWVYNPATGCWISAVAPGVTRSSSIAVAHRWLPSTRTRRSCPPSSRCSKPCGRQGEAGESGAGGSAESVPGDALRLPFPDGHFDRVLAAEILEHIPDDELAMAELARVLRPGGTAAVTVPRYLPERICWALSDAYHEVEGGHVRIYTGHELVDKLARAGLVAVGMDHVHGLHAPYWWLKCAVGVDNQDHPLPNLYHRMLVWDIVSKPWLTRTADRLLNPLIGKSLVVYLRKPESASAVA